MLEEINTTHAPGAVGPFSQAIKVDNLLFVSGQMPIDFATGEFNSDDAIAGADQCLKNLAAIAADDDTTLANLIQLRRPCFSPTSVISRRSTRSMPASSRSLIRLAHVMG
jgi:enamine deaminase RidA (YjgF/YER057c/UK114 family)